MGIFADNGSGGLFSGSSRRSSSGGLFSGERELFGGSSRRRTGGSATRSRSGRTFSSFDKEEFERVAREAANRNWFSQLLANAGGEVMDIVTGAPNAAQLSGRIFSMPVTTALGATRFIPGADNRVSDMLWREGQQSRNDMFNAGRGIVQNLEQNWGPAGSASFNAMKDPRNLPAGLAGPLYPITAPIYAAAVRGDDSAQRDLGRLGRNYYEHPVTMTLDAMAAYSAGGAAARAGSSGIARIGGTRFGTKLGLGQNTRVGQAFARWGDRSVLPAGQAVEGGRVSTGARYMPPRQYAAPATEGFAPPAIEVARPALSSNPFSRPFQRAYYRASDAIRGRAARLGDARLDVNQNSRFGNRFGTEGRYNKFARRDTRELAISTAERSEALARAADAEYRQAITEMQARNSPVRGGPGYSRAQLDEALRAHGEGEFSVRQIGGITDDGILGPHRLTPMEARDRILSQRRANLAEYDQPRVSGRAGVSRAEGPRPRTTQNRRNLDVYESLPEELVDLSKSPTWFRNAVEAQSRSQARISELSGIDPATVASRGQRTVEQFGLTTDRPGYYPHIPADPIGRTRPPQGPVNMAQKFGPSRIYRNEGQLTSRGGQVTNRAAIPYSADEAAARATHGAMVDQAIERFAVRGPDGRLLVAQNSDDVLRGLPEGQYVARSRKNLQQAAQEGFDLRGRKGLEALEKASQKADDMVVLPKAVDESIRTAIQPRRIPYYDAALGAWKGGILAYSPRWYLNNAFGNTGQSILMSPSGFADPRNWRQASASNRVSRALPDRVGASLSADVRESQTLTRLRPQLGGNPVSRTLKAGMERGYNINSRFENRIRRAGYVGRAKRTLRHEGVQGVNKMDDAALARAIQNMPKEAQAATLRDFNLFLGDYRRMSKFEQEIMRRTFPFYSWMRVIGGLMARFPVRHPVRAAVAAQLADVGTEIVNPDDFAQPWYNRGRLPLHIIPGGKENDLAMRTTAANPFTTHAELGAGLITAATTGIDDPGQVDWTPAISSLAGDISPVAQPILQQATRRNAFGRLISAPPGYQGAVQQFGREPVRVDPSTGQVEDAQPGPNWLEAAFQTIPLAPSLLRTGLAGQDLPYDVTRTDQLLRYRLGLGGNPNELFVQRSNDPTSTRPSLAPLLSWTGLSSHYRNREAERDRLRRQYEDDFRKAEEQTRKRRAKYGIR